MKYNSYDADKKLYTTQILFLILNNGDILFFVRIKIANTKKIALKRFLKLLLIITYTIYERNVNISICLFQRNLNK